VDFAIKFKKHAVIANPQTVTVVVIDEFFNVWAIREISQGLCFTINPFALLDFLRLLAHTNFGNANFWAVR
jgi:hypothetical protein